VEIVHEGQSFMMETGLFVSDFLHRAADSRFDFFLRARCPFTIFINALAADFAGEHDQLSRGQRFASDACFRVFRQKEIDDGVGNLVRNLVWMAFGNRFGGEEIVVTHGFSSIWLLCLRIKNSLYRRAP
jgi:hypothetical protein